MAVITMPALSPTMTEGKLARWLVKEGDEVRSGDVIAEIETDKALMEVEALEDGTVSRIMAAEGEEAVAVGAPIAEILGDDETPADIAAAPVIDTKQAEAPPPVAAAPGTSTGKAARKATRYKADCQPASKTAGG